MQLVRTMSFVVGCAVTVGVLNVAVLRPANASPEPQRGLPSQESSAPATTEAVNVTLTDSHGSITEVATSGKDAKHTAIGSGEIPGAQVSAPPTNEPEVAPHTNVTRSAVLTQAIAPGVFTVAALTWTGTASLGADHQIYFRVQESQGWSKWSPVSPDDSGRSDGVHGTDPFLTGSASKVQVQVTGDPASLPANLKIVVIGPRSSSTSDQTNTTAPTSPAASSVTPESQTPTAAMPTTPSQSTTVASSLPVTQPMITPTPSMTAPAASSSASMGPPSMAASTPLAQRDTGIAQELRVAAPQAPLSSNSHTSSGYTFEGRYGMSLGIHPRQDWDANSPTPTWDRESAQLQAAILHHTAGTNNYTQDQVPEIIAGIYNYHANVLGWGDIGYNFLVDKYGGMWEGRIGSLDAAGDSMVIGGHAYGNNTHSMGISAMGDYTLVDPSSAIYNAYAKIIRYRFALAGLNANDPSGFTSLSGLPLKRIFGHRDVNQTDCPGDAIEAWMPHLIATVGTHGPNPYSSLSDYRPWRDGGPTFWSTPYDNTLYVAGDSNAYPITFGEWRLWGFSMPTKANGIAEWISSPTIHARLQMGTAVTYPSLNYQQWATWGRPWPATVQVKNYLTSSSELFLVNPNRDADQLTFDQWIQWGAPSFSTSQHGFVKLSWDSSIATYTPGPAGNNYSVLSWADWRRWGYPSPLTAARFAGDSFCSVSGNPVWYVGPTHPTRYPITFTQWQAAGAPWPTICR